MFQKLLVVALKHEWSFLKKSRRCEKMDAPFPIYRICDHAALLQIGVGPERAGVTFARFLELFSCAHVLHFGMCGALDKSLKRGDLFLTRSVASLGASGTDFDAIPCAENTQNTLRGYLAKSSIPFHEGALCTWQSVLKNRQEKSSLAVRSGAQAVDMESFAVAKLCRDTNIPYNSLRGVFDAVEEDLEDIGEPYDVDGELNPFKLAANLVKSPGLILALPGLQRRTGELNRKMSLVLERYLAS